MLGADTWSQIPAGLAPARASLGRSGSTKCEHRVIKHLLLCSVGCVSQDEGRFHIGLCYM